MQLVTEELRQQLPPLYAQENVPDPVVHVKFFTPDSSWTWYATEGGYVCPEHGTCDCQECPPASWTDFLFFGYVIGLEKEWGYFALSEMSAARGPLGLPIERDLYFHPAPFSQVVKDA